MTDNDDFTDRRQLVLDGMKALPEHLREGLADYILERVPPGDYLRAVLSNDLRGTFERGDDESIAGLQPTVSWLYNHAPARCWGSREGVASWLRGEG